MEVDDLWDFNDGAASEAKFKQALTDWPDKRAELLTQLARSQGLQRKFGAARQTLDEAVEQIQPGTRERVRLDLEVGRVENSSGNPQAAKPHFTQAYNLALEIGEDALAVDAAHMLAIVEEPSKQLEWNKVALELAQSSNDPKAIKWQGSLYNNIGWTLHDSGDFAGALQMFQQAIPFREANGGGKPLRIARWCVARCLRSMGKHDEALAQQRQLESEGGGDYVFEEIAELLHLKSDSAAPEYFKRAYDDLSRDIWLTANEPQRLERLKQLAGL